MKLESTSGDAIALTVVGYQFPDHVAVGDRDFDANWLMVTGSISQGSLWWEFKDPCLLRWEAAQLKYWLQSVALGTVEPQPLGEGAGHLWFTEPNVSIRLLDAHSGSATLAFFFSQESSPPGSRDEVRFGEGHRVHITTGLRDIELAATAWSDELAGYPVR